MTSAEARNVERTVEEFRERLDEIIGEGLGAGLSPVMLREELELCMLGLEATGSATEAEKTALVGPVADEEW